MAQHGDGQQHQEGHEGDHMPGPPELVPVVEALQPSHLGGHLVAEHRPFLEVGHAVVGDAEYLGAESGDADSEERAQDHGVLGP